VGNARETRTPQELGRRQGRGAAQHNPAGPGGIPAQSGRAALRRGRG
jgi:hypothetical protein